MKRKLCQPHGISDIGLYRMTPYYQHCRLMHYAVVLLLSVMVAWLAGKVDDKKAVRSEESALK